MLNSSDEPPIKMNRHEVDAHEVSGIPCGNLTSRTPKAPLFGTIDPSEEISPTGCR